MRPNVEMNKTTSELAKVSNRIIDIFNHVEKLELDNIYPKEIGLKPILELRDLLIQEKKLYDQIAIDNGFNTFVRETIEKPVKFQMKFAINGDAQKRVITSIVSYFKNENNEFDYNVMIKYPEFMNLDFPNNFKNSSQICEAFNEEIYKEYLKKISEKINEPKHATIRDMLIKKKYNVLKTDAPTNMIYIKTFSPRLEEIRLNKVLSESKVNLIYFEYAKTVYVFEFFRLFFLSNLKMDNEEIYDKKNWSDMVDKLILAEIMLEMIDYEYIDDIKGLFDEVSKEIKIDNTIISELIIGLFEQKSQINRELKNKSMF